jgi:hypothetical protein
MLNSSAREKGKLLQVRLARALAYITGLGENDFYSARSGTKESDVRLSTEASARWPIHAECKNQRRVDLPGWWRQATSDSLELGTGLPGLCIKLHGRSMPLLVLSLDDFLGLLYGPLTPEQERAVANIMAPPRPKKTKGKKA